MTKEHVVLFVPGLDGRTKWLNLLSFYWPLFGLKPVMHQMVWRDQTSYEVKQQDLLEVVDKYVEQEKVVSGIGFSAGGSLTINTFLSRSDVMHKVVSVNGRLKKGPLAGFRTFYYPSKKSPSFSRSVATLEEQIPHIPESVKRRVMTTRAGLFDEVVPPETTTIDGVRLYTIPFGEHVLSSGLALLPPFSLPVIRFLTEGEAS